MNWPVAIEISFKDIFMFSSGGHVAINFGRGYHEEHFCKIILNLNHWFEEMSLKDISHLELWWPFVR